MYVDLQFSTKGRPPKGWVLADAHGHRIWGGESHFAPILSILAMKKEHIPKCWILTLVATSTEPALQTLTDGSMVNVKLTAGNDDMETRASD